MKTSTRILVPLVILTLLVPASGSAAVGDHIWSQGWSTDGSAWPDGSGHFAMAGSFFSSLDLGGGVMNPGNVLGGDVFLARFDNDGNHVWSQQFTPGGFGFMVSAVTAAPDGSIYLAGVLQNGDIDFGGGLLAGNQEIVIAAFETNGSHRWSMNVGSGNVQDLVASNGVVACTGYTYGTMDFGGGTMTSAGGADAFIGVVNADGSAAWGAVFGDTSGQGGMACAIDNADGVVLAATTESDIDFGGGVLTHSGPAADLCVVAFDAAGVHQWSWNVPGDFSPGSGILATVDLDVSPSGTIALGGEFLGTVDFGGGGLTAHGSSDAYVALYDGSGTHLASNHYGGNLTDTVQGVSFDANDNLAMSGNFLSPNADFGGSPQAHSGGFGADWFMAVFDNAGVQQYENVYTGNGQSWMAVEYNSEEDLVMLGHGSGGTDFGGGVLATTRIFLATLEGEGGGGSTATPPVRAGIELAQNAPNPFNPRTTIRFRLEEDASARLEIYDVAGRRVRTLVDGPMAEGEHTIAFDGRDAQGHALASGVYRYRLVSGVQELTRNMVLIK